MNRLLSSLFCLLLCLTLGYPSVAQQAKVPSLVWKVNRIDLGTILEEQGLQTAEFEFTYTQDSIFRIDEVVAECGCTSFDYTKDTLKMGESGKVILSLDPTSAAGFFSKLVVVKGNNGKVQDSLYLEGIAIPYPTNLERAYPIKMGYLGFRLRKVNMGDVFDNVPKVKYVEFFNFGEEVLTKEDFLPESSAYIQLEQVQDFVRSQERGLLKFSYDSKQKGDLGYFEEEVSIGWKGTSVSGINLEVMADLFEYFPPIPKDQLNEVPQLYIQQKEVDLREISSRTVVRRSVTLSNPGRKMLEIRKIQGNCDCLTIEAPKTTLAPGESMEIKLIFDPIGRRGIDQRNIYIFSNDPVNPVQLIVLKSRIE